MSDEQTLKLVADLEVEEGNQQPEDGLIHLSSGLVLKPRKVPPMILDKVTKQFPDPVIPKVKNEDKDQWIPNPDDPDYLEAKRLNEEVRNTALLDVLIGLGTDPEYVPPTLVALDDDIWVDEAEIFLNFSVPRAGRARYVAWLKYHALQDANDFQIIADRVTRQMGVSATEVQTAMNNFPRKAEREANPRTDVQVPSGNGD